MAGELEVDLSKVVNPLYLEGEESQLYLKYISRLRGNTSTGVPHFHGVEPFVELLNSRKIGIGIWVRVYNMGGVIKDPHYMLVRGGLEKVFPLEAEDRGSVYSLNDILSAKSNPDGWEIVDQDFLVDEDGVFTEG